LTARAPPTGRLPSKLPRRRRTSHGTAISTCSREGGELQLFEGVTIRNTEIGIWAGTHSSAWSKGSPSSVAGFRNVNPDLHQTTQARADFSFADARFSDATTRKHLFGWNGPSGTFKGVEARSSHQSGLLQRPFDVRSPGIVRRLHYIADFHDGHRRRTYGNPDGSQPIDGPSYPPGVPDRPSKSPLTSKKLPDEFP